MLKLKLILIISFFFCLKTGLGQPTQYVKVETPQGYCIVKLHNETPIHRDNFIRLVKSKYFDKTTFNRILKNFVIQGGDQDSLYEKGRRLNPQQKWLKPEFTPTLFHKRGVLAMGRDDNPGKESFSTQIYFVDGRPLTDAQLDAIEKRKGVKIPEEHRQIYRTIGGTPHLDGDYTVFGEIVKGIALIYKITALPVDKAGNPDTPVWMKMTILSPKQVAAELK